MISRRSRGLVSLFSILAVAPAGLTACSSSNSAKPVSDAGVANDATAGDGGLTPPDDQTAQATRDACGYKAGALAVETQGASQPDGATIPIDTIVVVMMENRSFDHYFQDLPNAGQPDVEVAPAGASNPGPDGTPVPFVRGTQLCFADTNHTWDGTHQEIADGGMTGFAVANDGTHETPMVGPPGFLSGARAMTYYTAQDLPFMYWAAANFAIGDHYFASVPGPTWPNREYLYAGTSFGETTTGAFPTHVTTTVLDNLDARGVLWGAYTDGLATNQLFATDKNFKSSYVPKTHSYAQFVSDAAANKLPPVVFVDPNMAAEGYSGNDEHPPAVMQIGQKWLADLVTTLESSPAWPHLALFLLYDEHGGLYDHVTPPKACAPDDTSPKGTMYDGFTHLGVRLPFVVFSPYAKRHYVSHKVYDHTSVLRFIEARHNLPALTNRDANALAPWDMFDFKAGPNLTPPQPPAVTVDEATLSACQTLFTSGDVAMSPYAM